jgi:hypothetical protein
MNRLRLILLLAVALSLLALVALAPRLQVRWDPNDYHNFLRYGNALRQGRTSGHIYPLPSLIWIFAPLSFTPDWFELIWVALPFVFCLVLFGPKGAVLWLSAPLLIHASQGQLDGWFLLPIFWLATDHALLAGPSAALLTLKPQLGIFIVPYMVYRWIRAKNVRSLLISAAGFLILYVPSLFIDRDWPLDFVSRAQWRGTQPLLQSRGASLWAWWWRDGLTQFLLPLAIILTIYLFIKAYRQAQAKAVFLTGLLATPVFFALSYTTAIAVLPKSLFAVLLFTVTSWVALIVDALMGGWGGAYALVPLVTLWLVANQDTAVANADKRLATYLGRFKRVEPTAGEVN